MLKFPGLNSCMPVMPVPTLCVYPEMSTAVSRKILLQECKSVHVPIMPYGSMGNVSYCCLIEVLVALT